MHGPLSLGNISIEESHRLIDAAIAQHQASILALKSQKNSLAPVSRLPPETLFEIFSLVKQPEEKFGTLKWITVTHVNSHWRRVAINSSSLWVNLPLRKLQWVEEMLKRSKDSGLEIEAYLGPDTGRTVNIAGLRAALQHSSRIKRLSLQDIYDASISQWNDLQKALPKFTPRLEYLCMTGYDRRNPDIFLSKEVFCKVERLRHLVLVSCTLNWDTHLHLLRSLTHLTLRNTHYKPTGKQFMDALKGMLHLEFLDMTNVLPVGSTWDSDRVHLAYLRTLSICSKHTEVQAFFYYVTFPPTAMVTVKCTIQDASTAHAEKSECADVILNLSRSYSNPTSDHVFRSLIYRPFSFHAIGVWLKLFTYVVADEQGNDFDLYVEASANLELLFEWTVTPPAHYIKMFMTSLFSSVLPIQDAAMHISFGGNYTEAEAHCVELVNIFRTMPQVCSVALERLSSAPFLKAMKLGSYVEDTGAMGQVEKLYFPNLSSLYFQGAKFSESGLSEDSTCVDPTCISIESLRDYLVQRSNSGAKIQKLIFEECDNLGQHDIHSLSAAVGKLDWDQYRLQQFSDSEDE